MYNKLGIGGEREALRAAHLGDEPTEFHLDHQGAGGGEPEALDLVPRGGGCQARGDKRAAGFWMRRSLISHLPPVGACPHATEI